MRGKRSRIAQIAIATSLIAIPVPARAADAPPSKSLRFHLYRDYLIVVPAILNGSGPYDFLVDTGCSTTMIDPELDEKLKAPLVGAADVALLSEIRRNRRVLLSEISLGPAKAKSFPVLVDKLDAETALAPGVRGILGEDFLKAFDVLIDYDRRTISFNEPAREGEQLAFADAGSVRGRHTFNRLMVDVAFPGAGGSHAVLQLDTAAWVTELFPSSHVGLASVGFRGREQAGTPDRNSTSPLYVKTSLRIGRSDFRNVTVALTRNGAGSDAAGLLPAAMFSSIFISHSGGFVILNPHSRRREARHNALELAALGEQ